MRRPTLLLLPLLTLLGACRDATIVTYSIPKETRAASAAETPNPHSPATPAAKSDAMPGGNIPTATGDHDLAWTAPASWKSKPGGSVRKGSYLVGDGTGPSADLSITAFPGDVGGDLANVNRWRSQIGLGPIAAAEFAGVLTHLDANGLHVDYVDLVNNGQRMLAAIVPHGGATWFVKLTGPDALVAAEKPAYIAFLNTLRPAS